MNSTEHLRNTKDDTRLSHYIEPLARRIGMQEWIIQRVNTPALAVLTALLVGFELCVAFAVFVLAVRAYDGIKYAIQFSNGR